MIYISHLDLLRLLGRAVRRAGLPVALTQGFSPRPRISVPKALKLGVASDHEEGEIVLNRPLEAAEIKQRLQAQLPEGITVKDVRSL
jgi:radical SAM-linked protein